MHVTMAETCACLLRVNACSQAAPDFGWHGRRLAIHLTSSMACLPATSADSQTDFDRQAAKLHRRVEQYVFAFPGLWVQITRHTPHSYNTVCQLLQVRKPAMVRLLHPVPANLALPSCEQTHNHAVWNQKLSTAVHPMFAMSSSWCCIIH